MADTSNDLIDEAIDRSDDEDYGGAIELLTQAIEANPRNARAFHERAMALLNLDKDHEALADFTRALDLDPKFPGARDWRARTLRDLGEHRRAAEDWLRDLRDHPNGPYQTMGVCPQTWADCAAEFAKAGDPARAIELLEEYLSQYASRVTAYACYETAPLRLLAQLLMDAGDTKRAEKLREQARASPHRVPADG